MMQQCADKLHEVYANHYAEFMQSIRAVCAKYCANGSYSKGLVDSVQMLVGEQESLVAYGLFPEQTVAALTEKLEKEINDTPEGEEILFLTDLFHGSRTRHSKICK